MNGELAGRLRERVTFSRPDETRDALGGRDGSWIDEGAAWAALTLAGRTGETAADARDAMPRLRVTLRAPADVVPGWRMDWGGHLWMVLAADADPAVPERVILIVEQMRESAD